MTRQSLPDLCNFCGQEIKTEMQYTSEWFQGKSSFSDPRVRLKERLDCCQVCFLNVCKHNFKPTWIKEARNPNWVQGSKKPEEKYYIEQNLEPAV